jgi:flagellar basal body-associated protein FliL
MKKGNLSIETIIVIVLALIVLAVITAIFITKARQGTTEMSECKKTETSGCYPKNSCPVGTVPSNLYKCPENQECCIGIS